MSNNEEDNNIYYFTKADLFDSFKMHDCSILNSNFCSTPVFHILLNDLEVENDVGRLVRMPITAQIEGLYFSQKEDINK